jgi:type I restriction enzyme S subunit
MTIESVTFGSIAIFRNGLNYSRENMGLGLKVISVGNFGDRMSPDYDSIGEIDPSGVAGDNDLLHDGDILFVRSNGNRELVARVMYITTPPHPVAYSGFCIRARMNKDVVNPKFYYYVFRSKDTRMRLVTGGVGANIVNVSQNALTRFEVPYPSRDIQDKCVSILSAYDDLIAANQHRIQLLEESARLLYREWFVKLRFPGYEALTVQNGVPDGWEHTIIGEVCDSIGGGTPSTAHPEYWGGDITWITPTDLTHNDCLVLLDSEKKISESGLRNSSAKMVPAETILMTSRASIGFFALINKPVCTNQGFISIVPLQEEARLFLLQHLLGRVEEIKSIATGATFKEITKKSFRNLPILWPTSNILLQFNDLSYPLIQQVRYIKTQNELLKQARDMLLPKLMSGALDVSRITVPKEVEV